MSTKKNGGTPKHMEQKPLNPTDVIAAPPRDTILVKEEDQKIIRELDQEMLRTKVELANITAQLHVLQGQQHALAQKLLDIDRGFFERIKKTAGEYGINLENEKWNFDASRMAFSKQA